MVKPLVFHHVPKAGGASLKSIFDIRSKKITDDNQNYLQTVAECKKFNSFISPENFLDFDLITGHWCAKKYEKLIDDSRFLSITIMRDPIERLLSNFYQSYYKDGFREQLWGDFFVPWKDIKSNSVEDSLEKYLFHPANQNSISQRFFYPGIDLEIFDIRLFLDDLAELDFFPDKNSRDYEKNINPDLRHQLEQFHSTDMQFYEYFLSKKTELKIKSESDSPIEWLRSHGI